MTELNDRDHADAQRAESQGASNEDRELFFSLLGTDPPLRASVLPKRVGQQAPFPTARRLLCEVLVVLLVGLGVAAWIGPRVRTAREASCCMSCRLNLNRIGMAILDVYYATKKLPPAYTSDKNGKPLHSWRVLILPHLHDPECQALHDAYKFEEPWDGPHNSLLASRMPSVYRCASDTTAMPGETNYMVVVGPNTLFPGEQSRGFRDTRGRASGTLMVVEVAGTGVNWMSPEDLQERQLEECMKAGKQAIGGRHAGRTHLLMSDGEAYILRGTLSAETLRTLADTNPDVPFAADPKSLLSRDPMMTADYEAAVTAVRLFPEGICYLGLVLLLGAVSLRVLCAVFNKFVRSDASGGVHVPSLLRAIAIVALTLIAVVVVLGIVFLVSAPAPRVTALLGAGAVGWIALVIEIAVLNRTAMGRALVLGTVTYGVLVASCLLPVLL